MAEPEFAAVLSATHSGMPEATERLLLEVRNYPPRAGGSAVGLTAMIRIYLLAQIDAMWWGHLPALVTDRDVLSSADLVDLEPLRRRRLLGFPVPPPATKSGRAGPRARQSGGCGPAGPRVQLACGSPVPGPRRWLCSTRCRQRLPRSARPARRRCGSPAWHGASSTSTVCAALGYTATLPSSHCVGYAVDIEMSWFRRFGAHRGLEGAAARARGRGRGQRHRRGTGLARVHQPSRGPRLAGRLRQMGK